MIEFIRQNYSYSTVSCRHLQTKTKYKLAFSFLCIILCVVLLSVVSLLAYSSSWHSSCLCLVPLHHCQFHHFHGLMTQVMYRMVCETRGCMEFVNWCLQVSLQILFVLHCLLGYKVSTELLSASWTNNNRFSWRCIVKVTFIFDFIKESHFYSTVWCCYHIFYISFKPWS